MGPRAETLWQEPVPSSGGSTLPHPPSGRPGQTPAPAAHQAAGPPHMSPPLTQRGVRTWLGGSPPEPGWPSECLSQGYGGVEGERPDTAGPTASAATGRKGQGATGNRGSLSCPTSDSGPAEKSRLLAPTPTGRPASLEPALACPLPHRPPAACLKPASAPPMADISACSPPGWRVVTLEAARPRLWVPVELPTGGGEHNREGRHQADMQRAGSQVALPPS